MTVRYWLGAAVAVPEVKAYIFDNTWATGDTATMTINGKSLVLTAGATATVAQVALDFVAMVNGAAANGTESRSALGSAVGEFSNLTAVSMGAASGEFKLVGPSNGRPIGTVTLASTTAGDGTFAAIGAAPDVTGTGPNFYSDLNNWSGGAVPVDSDDIVFDHQAAGSCLFGLAQTSVTPTTVTITKGFKYAIGLPAVNSDDKTHPFNEHLDQYLQYDGATTVNVDASASQMIKIDAGTKQSAFNVTSSGTTTETGAYPIMLKGSHASNTLSVASGSVGFCTESAVAGTLTTVFVGGGQSPSLDIGSGVTATTISQQSGTITNRSAATVTTLNQTGGTFDHRGVAITTANVSGGGSLLYNSTTALGTLYLAGATLDATKDARGKTVSNCHVYAGSTIKDPMGSIAFSNGIKLYCKPSEASLDLVARKTYTIGAI